ncbi:MAG: hypothetical protein RML12_04830 [Xanthomonadales bacterium]|nr:hypothetical protein [Xanthomonadales bacterium]
MIRNRILAVAALLLAPALAHGQVASISVSPATINGVTTGGPTTPPNFALRFQQPNPPNNIVGFQADLCLPGPIGAAPGPIQSYTLTPASIPNYLISCVTVPGNTTTCPAPNAVVRVLVLNQVLTAAQSPFDYCTITLTIRNGALAGSYPLDVYDQIASDPLGNPVQFAANDGNLVITALQGPNIVFTPDGTGAGPGTPITLTASGATATTSIQASSAGAGNAGDPGGPNGQIVNCSFSGPDATHFSFNPAVTFPITYTAGTARTDNFTVQCNRGPTNRNAQLRCQVQDRGGNRDEWYDLTCPGALPADLNLPPSGAITMPGGVVGQTVTTTLPVTVVTQGEAGAANATVNCTTAAPLSISPATVTVPPQTGTAQPFTISCTLTNAVQNGTVNCTINDRGGTETRTYNVTCPAGSIVPPPRPIPAGSPWGWYLLGLLTLALGGLVAWRRLG